MVASYQGNTILIHKMSLNGEMDRLPELGIWPDFEGNFSDLCQVYRDL